MNFIKIFNAILATLSSPSLYWQLISVSLCFALSYLIYKFSKKFLLSYLPNDLASSNSGTKLAHPRTKTPCDPNNNDLLSKARAKPQSFLSRSLNQWPLSIALKHSSYLLLPLITTLMLIFAYFPYSLFFKDNIIFSATIKIVGCFLFLRLIRISSASPFTASLAGIFLLPTLILDIFGALQPVISCLNDLSFKIGKVKISAFLVIKAFIVIFFVFWLASWISRKSRYYIDSNRRIKSSTKGILNKIADILIYSIAVIFVLRTFGVDLTTFAVIGGAVGVGIGLGLQKIASNFISGIILLFEKSVEVGDIVEVDNGNIYGTVKHFSGRYTLVEAMDGKEILIPNEEFITQKVINWTYSNSRARVEINVNVSYGTDLRRAKEIMMTCARNHPRCLINPEIECFVVSFDDSSIRLVLYFWIADIVVGRMGAKSEVMISIYEEFTRHGIEIPIPQREVKIKKDDDLPLFRKR